MDATVAPYRVGFPNVLGQRLGILSSYITHDGISTLSLESIELILPGKCKKGDPIADCSRASSEKRKHAVAYKGVDKRGVTICSSKTMAYLHTADAYHAMSPG